MNEDGHRVREDRIEGGRFELGGGRRGGGKKSGDLRGKGKIFPAQVSFKPRVRGGFG